MTCKECIKFKVDVGSPSFGWCTASERRIAPNAAFLNGTTPSTRADHGRDCLYFEPTTASKTMDEEAE
jgi:hypothetical protein